MENLPLPFHTSLTTDTQADLITLLPLPHPHIHYYPPCAVQQLIFNLYHRLHEFVTLPTKCCQKATSWKGYWNEIYAALWPSE